HTLDPRPLVRERLLPRTTEMVHRPPSDALKFLRAYRGNWLQNRGKNCRWSSIDFQLRGHPTEPNELWMIQIHDAERYRQILPLVVPVDVVFTAVQCKSDRIVSIPEIRCEVESE